MSTRGPGRIVMLAREIRNEAFRKSFLNIDWKEYVFSIGFNLYLLQILLSILSRDQNRRI